MKGRFNDLTGWVMNEHGIADSRLTVLYRIPNRNNKVFWHCLCECGKEVDVRSDQLTRGIAKSCGCIQREIARNNMQNIGKQNSDKPSLHREDLSGKKFGKLTVLYVSNEKIESRKLHWYCRCECGNITIVSSTHLRSGHTQSCGCLKSKGELKICQLLTKCNIKYEQQYSFNDLYYKSIDYPLKFDFAVFNNDNTLYCLIEFQGPQHFDVSNKWYSTEQIERDNLKRQYCIKNNFKLIEINYTEYQNLTEEYLKEILKCQE